MSVSDRKQESGQSLTHEESLKITINLESVRSSIRESDCQRIWCQRKRYENKKGPRCD